MTAKSFKQFSFVHGDLRPAKTTYSVLYRILTPRYYSTPNFLGLIRKIYNTDAGALTTDTGTLCSNVHTGLDEIFNISALVY
jgi:hypothetical protein